MPKLMLSAVGTSVLANRATREQRERLMRHANMSEQDCPQAVRQLVERLSAEARTHLAAVPDDAARIARASAELHGVLGIYANRWNGCARDQHVLVGTDTLPGRAAGVLMDVLRGRGCTAQPLFPRNLSTQDQQCFGEGVKELLRWCDETLPGYHDAGYEIIFNLTGGFKSLQGVLNTIGMFYADRIVYVFEAGGLITIPRLPIRLDSEVFRHNRSLLLRLATGHTVSAAEVAHLPEALVDIVDDQAILSVWGDLA